LTPLASRRKRGDKKQIPSFSLDLALYRFYAPGTKKYGFSYDWEREVSTARRIITAGTNGSS